MVSFYRVIDLPLERNVMDTANCIHHVWEKEFPLLKEAAIREFATRISDHNPIHHDNAAARAAGLQGIIATAVQMIGFISAAIAEEVPGAIISRLDLKFRRPLYAGALPSVQCVVGTLRTGVTEISINLCDRSQVLVHGHCILKMPKT